MSNTTKQIENDGPPQCSDEMLRRFLLGQLSATEQSMFEQRLLADDTLEARVRLAEYELADDYAFERLSAAQRELFEARFLVTTGRKDLLSVSNALRDRFAYDSATPFESKTSVGARLRALLGLDQPTRRLALVIVVLVILVGATWLVTKEPHINKRLIARRPPATPTPVEKSEVHHPSGGSTAQPHEDNPSPMPEHEPLPASPPVVVSVVLFAGTTHESRVNLPTGERDILRLQLAPKRNITGPFRAELLTAAGQSVCNAPAVKLADGAKISFDVPARLLKAGDYQVRLSLANEGVGKIVTTYYFRAR